MIFYKSLQGNTLIYTHLRLFTTIHFHKLININLAVVGTSSI